MKQLIVLLVLAGLVWFGYRRYTAQHAVDPPAAATPAAADPSGQQAQRFHCDGRQYCSQMHSCAEATYFLRNCPNTKMDGNHDGVPCERQWCR